MTILLRILRISSTRFFVLTENSCRGSGVRHAETKLCFILSVEARLPGMWSLVVAL